jgi:hypothetical protein
MNYIYPDIRRANNDRWITTPLVNATPVSEIVSDPMIETIQYITTGDANIAVNNTQPEFYKNFGIDIVAETVFNNPYPFITDKTIRPIACKRMFIIAGPSGTLGVLHSKGFKTFTPFINEEYDQVKDNTEWFCMLTTEIKRICEMTIEEIKDACYRYSNRLEHNFSILQNLTSVEIEHLKKSL